MYQNKYSYSALIAFYYPLVAQKTKIVNVSLGQLIWLCFTSSTEERCLGYLLDVNDLNFIVEDNKYCL